VPEPFVPILKTLDSPITPGLPIIILFDSVVVYADPAVYPIPIFLEQIPAILENTSVPNAVLVPEEVAALPNAFCPKAQLLDPLVINAKAVVPAEVLLLPVVRLRQVSYPKVAFNEPLVKAVSTPDPTPTLKVPLVNAGKELPKTRFVIAKASVSVFAVPENFTVEPVVRKLKLPTKGDSAGPVFPVIVVIAPEALSASHDGGSPVVAVNT
jgi:hypothetical protein